MYNPTYWNNNDTPSISADNLNKIENGIADTEKNAVPDFTIFFDENGAPLASTTATTFSGGSFSAIVGTQNALRVKTVFVARNVTELSSGFSSGLNNLSTVYIDAPESSIDITAPGGNVTIRYGGDYKLSGFIWKNILSAKSRMDSLQQQINNLPSGGTRTYGTVEFVYGGSVNSAHGDIEEEEE